MNRSELKQKLEREGVRTDLYSLSGGNSPEALVLNRNGNQWEVYYSERGYKNALETFDNESDACENIYPKIKDYAGELKNTA